MQRERERAQFSVNLFFYYKNNRNGCCIVIGVPLATLPSKCMFLCGSFSYDFVHCSVCKASRDRETETEVTMYDFQNEEEKKRSVIIQTR